MATHEFGIMEQPPEPGRWYSVYEPEKYNCVYVDDEIIEPLWAVGAPEAVLSAPTYYQTLSQPGKGLDYTGVTLIPPDSLAPFIDYFLTSCDPAEAWQLTDLLKRAQREGKFVIHFGI